MPAEPLPFLDGAAIRAAVPMNALLDAVQAAYRDVAEGRDRSPLRTRVELPNGQLLMMAGVRTGAAGSSVKLVTITPENVERGLPTVQAIVLWLDAVTGQPLAMLDGEAVTAMRTGAASGVATRLLARSDAATLALIGAGAQAEWQLRAVIAARRIRRVLVYSRSPERRGSFAEAQSELLGMPVVAVSSGAEAMEEADVVCCATTSTEPVFDARWVRPGTHVNGIGAFRLGMVELPPELLARAAVVAVDARHAALAEAGDVVAAIESGLLPEASLVEIGTVSPDWASSRDPEAVTVFKSVGLAIQDLVTAELATMQLRGN